MTITVTGLVDRLWFGQRRWVVTYAPQTRVVTVWRLDRQARRRTRLRSGVLDGHRGVDEYLATSGWSRISGWYHDGDLGPRLRWATARPLRA